jgi:hypothetical protein
MKQPTSEEKALEALDMAIKEERKRIREWLFENIKEFDSEKEIDDFIIEFDKEFEIKQEGE